jgi:hypothetical protein
MVFTCRRQVNTHGIPQDLHYANPMNWSEKPGLRRFTPQMRPNSEL